MEGEGEKGGGGGKGEHVMCHTWLCAAGPAVRAPMRWFLRTILELPGIMWGLSGRIGPAMETRKRSKEEKQ